MASKLAAMQARFQQKQMQEREEKLLRLYENQQQRAFDRVGRNSAGSNSSVGSTGGGKVRQLFEERRKAGVDKSYPLEPINGKINGKIGVGTRRQPVINSRKTTLETTVQRGVVQVKNGKPTINKRETVRKIYNNNNGVEKFEENRYNENFLDSQNNLVNMMNRHNIYDNLEDEQSPPLEEGDDDLYFGKLANVGGKPPSQNQAFAPKTRDTPVKTIVRKSPVISKTQISQKSNPSSRTPSRKSSLNSSPQHSNEKMPQVNSKSGFTPSTDKPSSRQAAPRVATCPVTRDDLQECGYCNRRFATERIKKHEEVCRQTSKKQRKAYDAFKHRVQGTELEQFTGGGKKKSSRMVAKKPTASGGKKSNWRRTHEEFIATIRSAKMAQAHVAGGGKLSDLPPPPPTSNPDYVQCPHCGRRFNEAAAERHIPKCANFEFNKPKLGAAKKR